MCLFTIINYAQAVCTEIKQPSLQFTLDMFVLFCDKGNTFATDWSCRLCCVDICCALNRFLLTLSIICVAGTALVCLHRALIVRVVYTQCCNHRSAITLNNLLCLIVELESKIGALRSSFVHFRAVSWKILSAFVAHFKHSHFKCFAVCL